MHKRATHRGLKLVVAAVSSVLFCSAAPRGFAQIAPASSYVVGQSVEVREGDQWSKAKVIAREGRRVQVRYEDGTEEWVSADRLRTPGAAPAAQGAKPGPADASPTPATKPAVAKPAAKRYAVGSAVEVKWGGTWRKATIKNTRGEWYLATYENTPWLEWVEPWRVRAVGSDVDVPFAKPNPTLRAEKIDPPPRAEPGPLPAEGGGHRDGGGEDVPGMPLTAVDAAKVRTPSRDAPAAWAYKPADAAPPRLGDAPIDVPAAEGGTVAMDVVGSVAMVVLKEHGNRGGAVAHVVHVGTGATIVHAEFDLATLPASVAADGRRIFARGAGRSDRRVDVWDVAGQAKPKHVVGFEPYANEFFKGVTSVTAIDATHLITQNVGGALMAWELGDGAAAPRPLWKMQVAAGSRNVSVSPDRRTLATLDDTRLLLVDALDGTVRGAIDAGTRRLSSMSFRADGKRLCALDDQTLFEFDLERGVVTQAIGLPAALSPARGALHLGGDNVFLAGQPGGPVVLDVARLAVAGRYVPGVGEPQDSIVVGDRLFASVKDGPRRSLCSWRIPAAAAAKPALPLAIVPADGATTVAIELNIAADDRQKADAMASLRRQVVARGWKVAGDVGAAGPATVRVVARTEDGPPEKHEYTRRGNPFGPAETATVVPKISRVTIEVDGKPAWVSQTVNSVGNATQIEGTREQSAQEMVDANSRFDLGFFASVRLPNTVALPLDALPATLPKFSLMYGGVRAD